MKCFHNNISYQTLNNLLLFNPLIDLFKLLVEIPNNLKYPVLIKCLKNMAILPAF